jgi:transcriptional regulator GlxA family with amidase domain
MGTSLTPAEVDAVVKLGGLAVALVLAKILYHVVLALVNKYLVSEKRDANGNGNQRRRSGDLDPAEWDERIAKIVTAGHDIQDERLANIVVQAMARQNEAMLPVLQGLATAVQNSNRQLERAEEKHNKVLNVLYALMERVPPKANGKSASGL